MERFGTHRSIDPKGVLPQQARVLDATSPLTPEEVGIDVEYLNIDSASWHQMRQESNDSPEAMKRMILDVVKARGKMQNPVTGSGGMLVGTVREIGAHRMDPKPGTLIATLVSLTLTPLVLDEIVELNPESEKVRVKGRAILFGSGIYAPVPDDMDDELVLGVLDVCGAPAWAAKLCRPGQRVVVIGAGGKSGMLTCAQAVKSTGADGRVLGLCWPESTALAAKDAGAEAITVDCTDPMSVHDVVAEAFEGGYADLVFVCANVPGCEGGAILAAEDGGRVVFFSMATSFTTAALVAEGLGKSCNMTIGNGFVPGHAELALDLVRSDPRLQEWLTR
ncbi:MAG TPA: L-erythro-3,5-diaminohexanoate dehydrogenase [Actinomycetota bacterium]|nr:L-erythro-3,5-diaminohexanoate dehydrogenase [Actinomycetota bacterium]